MEVASALLDDTAPGSASSFHTHIGNLDIWQNINTKNPPGSDPSAEDGLHWTRVYYSLITNG